MQILIKTIPFMFLQYKTCHINHFFVKFSIFFNYILISLDQLVNFVYYKRTAIFYTPYVEFIIFERTAFTYNYTEINMAATLIILIIVPQPYLFS